jgi:hypothetical protein
MSALMHCQTQCIASEGGAAGQSSAAGRNIEDALKFLDEMGSREAAAALTKAYREGRIRVGAPPPQSSAADSGREERTLFIPEAVMQTESSQDKLKSFAAAEKLARSLLFESALSRNDRDPWFVYTLAAQNGESYYRWKAWVLTLREMGKWTGTLLASYQATSRENRGALYDIINKARVIYGDKIECLDNLLKEDCVDKSDQHSFRQWRKMLESLNKELGKVRSEIESGGETDLAHFAWDAFWGWGSVFSNIVKGDTTERRLDIKEWSVKFSIDAEATMGDMAYSCLPKVPQKQNVVYSFALTGPVPGKVFEMGMTNKTDQPLSLSLPAGLVLVSQDSQASRLIVGEASSAGAMPYETWKQSIFVYAMDYGKDTQGAAATQALEWKPMPDRDLTAKLDRIITTAKRLSVNEQYQQSVMAPEAYRNEITQRSIWYSLTKGTGQEVGKESLRLDLEKLWKALPQKERPRYEDKARTVELLWSCVELTVKEAEQPAPSTKPSDDDSWDSW